MRPINRDAFGMDAKKYNIFLNIKHSLNNTIIYYFLPKKDAKT